MITFINKTPPPPPLHASFPPFSTNDMPPRPTTLSETVAFHLHGYHGPPTGSGDNIFRPFSPSTFGNVILPFASYHHPSKDSFEQSSNRDYPVTHMYHHSHHHTTSTSHTLETFDSPQSSVIVKDRWGNCTAGDVDDSVDATACYMIDM